jgi:hypothetical protein
MDDENQVVIQRILARKGKVVHYKCPGNEGHRKGVLKDRVVMRSNPDPVRGVPYWDVVDLIEFLNEDGSKWIRVGYYRKPGDRLVWVSQTTLTDRVSNWKKLFVKAASEKTWFRELLNDVMNELEGME